MTPARPFNLSTASVLLFLAAACPCDAWMPSELSPWKPSRFQRGVDEQFPGGGSSSLFNAYDDWRSDAVAPVMYLDEDNVKDCLELFVESDYGQTMFGCHERPASVGVTGEIAFVDLQGPQVTLHLSGKFWHKRSTVLGRTAVWLNACMPEITDVNVQDREELEDTKEIRDEFTGELLEIIDKRSPDFNGDRATMEYQGIDPDVRGPFPRGPMDKGSSMWSPA